MAELNPEIHAWASTVKTNAILADIFDMLAMINANLTAIGSRRAAKKPKPYPRPGKDDKDTRHFGSGALPVEDLHRWIEDKRNAGSSTGDHNGHSGARRSTAVFN